MMTLLHGPSVFTLLSLRIETQKSQSFALHSGLLELVFSCVYERTYLLFFFATLDYVFGSLAG